MSSQIRCSQSAIRPRVWNSKMKVFFKNRCFSCQNLPRVRKKGSAIEFLTVFRYRSVKSFHHDNSNSLQLFMRDFSHLFFGRKLAAAALAFLDFRRRACDKESISFRVVKNIGIIFFFLEASDGRSFLIKKFQAKDGVLTEQSSCWARKEEIKNVKIK